MSTQRLLRSGHTNLLTDDAFFVAELSSEQGLHVAVQPVAGAAFGDDQLWLGRVRLDHQAQAADLDVDRTVVDLAFVQPGHRQQLIAGQHSLRRAAIGGSLSGLATGASVTLQDNASDTLTLSANGTFSFANKIAGSNPYNVTVLNQPAGQTCAVTNGSVTFETGTVNNIAVTCG